MRRGAPLQRKQPLVTRTPMRGTNLRKTGAELGGSGGAEGRSRPRPKDTGPSRAVRRLVWARDHGTCCACGRALSEGDWWSIQHRKARGQQGDNSPCNLLVLCGSATSAGCHRRAEDRDPEYHDRGYWLNSWEDPATTPVMICGPQGGFTAFLTADGKYLLESAAGVTS